ncbi:hypothetical protein P2318_30300 [Myxococcaceae bacterium GXIMD 01537]
MRKAQFGLAALLVGLMAVAVTACGDDDPPPGNKPTSKLWKACAADSACGAEEICHPEAKVCVRKCSAASECPDSAQTCEALSGSNTQKVCKCGSDAQCEKSDLGTSGVCGDAHQVCQARCTSTSCGSGQVCDAASGECKPDNGTKTCSPSCTAGNVCDTTTGQCKPDNTPKTCSPACGTGEVCNTTTGKCEPRTCSPACGVGEACNTNTGKCETRVCAPVCTGNQVCDNRSADLDPFCVDRCTWDGCQSSYNCNLDTGLCDAAESCDSTQPQPDACAYGQYCTQSDLCDFVPKDSCTAFTNGSHQANWNPSSSNGPIVYAVEKVRAEQDDSRYCDVSNSKKRWVVRVKAYRTSGTFTSSGFSLADFHYVLSNGTEDNDAYAALNVNITEQGRHVTFEANICTSPQAELQFGVYFNDGNEVCATIK